MAEACEKAIAAGEMAKVKQLFVFARKCDQVMTEAAGDSQLCDNIAELIAKTKLHAAAKMLGQETGMNPMTVLDCLKTVRAVWTEIGCKADLIEQISGVRDLILKRMQASMDDAAKVGNRKKAEALVKFGLDYDEVLSTLDAQGGISEKLACSLMRVASWTGAGVGDDFLSDEWINAEGFASTDAISSAFRKWDSEGNGKMAKGDFTKVVKALDPRFSAEMVESLFNGADSNADGVIDYEEFIAWLFR